jgi:hypothetical protein
VVAVAVALVVAEADGKGEEAAASNDRATAGGFPLARLVSVAKEEAPALDAQGLEKQMRCQVPVLSAATLLVVEGQVAELAALGHCAAVVALTVLAALSRRRPAGLPGSRTM